MRLLDSRTREEIVPVRAAREIVLFEKQSLSKSKLRPFRDADEMADAGANGDGRIRGLTTVSPATRCCTDYGRSGHGLQWQLGVVTETCSGNLDG